jgi:hypothetical protein
VPRAEISGVSIHVLMGNVAARDSGKPLGGARITQVGIPDGTTFSEGLRDITHEDGVWVRHSSKPPAWVVADNKLFAEVLAEHYGCPVGRPEDWPGY